MQYDLPDLVSRLAYRLDEKYAEESILAVELSAVVQALFTSLRWSVLRSAKQIARGEEFTERVLNIETTDHFATEWMDRGEIIDRIMLTSGLNEEMSADALSAIEEVVDSGLVGLTSVRIVGIGDIRSTEFPRYYIELDVKLSVGGSAKQSLTATSE